MSQEYYSDKEYEKLLLNLGELTKELDKIENPIVKDQIEEVLKHFDAIHREPLSRLIKYLDQKHTSVLKKLRDDYSIRQLLALYDLGAFTGVETAKDQVAFISSDQVKVLK